MYSLNAWRALPPAGAPLSFTSILRAFAAWNKGERALEELTQAVARLFAVPHVFLHGSGREALTTIFTALRTLHPEHDLVLLPAYGSFSLPSAVVKAGCRVGLYDVNPDTLTPCIDSVQAALGPRTLAVVACHQFGFPFDLAPLEDMCRKRGTYLVDDAAQALGAQVAGKQAGTMGDVGIFSLSRGKNITSIAGGISLTRNPVLAKAMAATRTPTSPHTSWGHRPLLPISLVAKTLALWGLRHPALYRIPVSMPWLQIGASLYEPDYSRADFSAFQAGLALFSLEQLEAITAARTQRAVVYQQHLQGQSAMRPILAQAKAVPAYLRFPLVPGSDAPQRWLRKAEHRSLGISAGFPLALHEIQALAPHLDTSGGPYPGALFLARNLVTLPTHDHVRPEDIQAVVRHLQLRAHSPAVASFLPSTLSETPEKAASKENPLL